MSARACRSCLLFLLVVFPRTPLDAQSLPSRRVVGAIVDAHTEVALAGVHVRLMAWAPSPDEPRATNAVEGERSAARETVTDAAGAFAVESVASGRYRIAVAVDGFEAVTAPRDIGIAEEA